MRQFKPEGSQMNFNRASGILIHPSSFPGPYGIGDIGPEAKHFLDWLAGAGCKLWQVLPLGPTGYGDSPYQCFSAFAGNPYLISPEYLLRDDLLHPNDLREEPVFPVGQVDFGRVIPWKQNLLERAYIRFSHGSDALQSQFEQFCIENSGWLSDYGLFMAIKEANGAKAWGEWPIPLRSREPEALTDARKKYSEGLRRYSFYQFVFMRQWKELRGHAQSLGIQIIGDIPIFVAYDSADVWSHPNNYYLDEAGQPSVVAGVPPDYFSETGQLWGNPLYHWDILKQDNYHWWIERLRTTLDMVDVVRLDHFRGFAGYWEIPAGSPTAETGRWVSGPGEDFFTTTKNELDNLPIIAEDLGEITPDVIALRDTFKLPGMKILQFGFSGPDNAFLPHNITSNFVVYTGTHDNDTAIGWFATAPENERDFALRYLDTTPVDFASQLIRAAWASRANFALAPMQDMLGLGTEARMNFPGKLGGNWRWRMPSDALTDELQMHLRELNYLFLR
jgi:4-alpha-glucanotransferase